MANKLVSLRLVSLYYGGESIGDDLTIEARAADRMVTVGRVIRAARQLRRTMGCHRDCVSIPLILRVIERDPVFDDVRELTASMSVKLAQEGATTSRFQIILTRAA